LLDEPLSNLDARLRLEMRAELKRIHSAFGTTIVFVTHDQWEAMTLATQIAVMNQGTLQQVGTPEDIYDRPANRFVAEFVGSPPINIVEMHDGGDAGLRQALRAHLQGDFADGAEIASVGMRPENIQIAASPAAVSESDFQRPMVVTAVLPTGGSWIVEMEDNGSQLFATTNQPPVLNAGDKGVYSMAPGAMHSFDGKGARLQPLAEEASATQNIRVAG
ncbi:MAG: ABC transporter ATP-binding protein, partial [Pseudomonadota bacterium]|nr:ABC transporter ATP-binding protein [Pseudomonadota bacterium]